MMTTTTIRIAIVARHPTERQYKTVRTMVVVWLVICCSLQVDSLSRWLLWLCYCAGTHSLGRSFVLWNEMKESYLALILVLLFLFQLLMQRRRGMSNVQIRRRLLGNALLRIKTINTRRSTMRWLCLVLLTED